MTRGRPETRSRFRSPLFSLAGVLVCLAAAHAEPATLRNQDVAKMVQAGLSHQIIISTIESQQKDFDLSSEGLIGLRDAGVPENIITAMLQSVQVPRAARAAAPAPAQAAAPARPAAPREVLVPEGTEIRVRLLSPISSKDARPEDRLSFEVLEDVLVDGAVVVKRDARGKGRVTEAQKSRSFGRKGKLSFAIDSVEAVDGQSLPVRTEQKAQGTGKVGTAVVVAYFGGPLGLLVKGKQAEVPAGSEFTVFTAVERKISP
jgi:hypothetical protein